MPVPIKIPNLINGVSTQPPPLRLASQAEEQINCWGTVAEGLRKRPPTRKETTLSPSSGAASIYHLFDTGSPGGGIYFSIFNGILHATKATSGQNLTVTAPNGFGYLAGATPETIRFISVADHTFVLNIGVTPQMSTDLTPARPNQGMIWVRGGNYGKTYTVTVNGTEVASFKTRDGSSAVHIEDVETTRIATELFNDMVAALPSPEWTITRDGALISITRNNTTPFTMAAEDGAGGSTITSVVSSVQRFTDLPKIAPDGFVVSVAGDASSGFDDYYLKFTSEGGSGVWKETVKGGEVYRFDPATMPHIIVQSGTSYQFRQADWAARAVGDADIMGQPSFVGNNIRDVFFYRNRLGFLAGENVILSQMGQPFNFWRDTATTILDTDPIDTAVPSNEVSILHSALPFGKNLLLFSRKRQFILRGGEILSQETAFIDNATEFDVSSTVRPVSVGANAYFPVMRGTKTGVREYLVEDGNLRTDAADISAHCGAYLPRNISALVGSTAEDVLFVQSPDEPNALWVYKFFFGSEGKLQSAWSKWVFPHVEAILHVAVQQSFLLLVVDNGETVDVEMIDMSGGSSVTEFFDTFPAHIDAGAFSFGYGSVFTGTNTTIPLGRTMSGPVWVLMQDFMTGEVTGFLQDLDGATSVTLPGDFRNHFMFTGYAYESTYTFSTLFLRESSETGVLSYTKGRTQLLNMQLGFDRTGYFEVHVARRGRPLSKAIYSALNVGGPHLSSNADPLQDGTFKVSLLSRNTEAVIQLTSNHFLPFGFNSADVEANIYTK